MKPFVLSLCLLVGTFCSAMQPAARYTRTDSLHVVQLLKEYQKATPAKPDWMFFARRLLGTPYVAATLEVGQSEQLVVNLRGVDCTTFVNQVLALNLAAREGGGFKEFCHYLQQLRYRDGKLDGYASRLHYYSDAILNNSAKGFYQELGQTQKARFPFLGKQILALNYMTTHPEAYPRMAGRPDVVRQIAQSEKRLSGLSVRYIPVSLLRNDTALKHTIRTGDIIVIVTRKRGLDTSHLGFAVWQKGHLHLLNASSIHHKVVLERMTLYQYMMKHPSQIGIRVVRPR